MMGFLELPREIRDLVYVEVILWERSPPAPSDAGWWDGFRRISSPQSTITGEYGCAYSYAATPQTCANVLCCSRQINAEMSEAIQRVRRKGMVKARMHCIAQDESLHYFTWLAMPLVHTAYGRGNGKNGLVTELVGRWIKQRWWSTPGTSVASSRPITKLSRLWIDVQIAGDRSAKWLRNTTAPDRTSWAICAALKRLFIHGPHLSHSNAQVTGPIKMHAARVMVEELVLNVLPSQDVPPLHYLDEDYPANATGQGVVHPKSLASELVDVWHQIWRAESYKATLYQILLERIERVRVCVDGEVWRARELQLELERGRAEGRRLAARGR